MNKRKNKIIYLFAESYVGTCVEVLFLLGIFQGRGSKIFVAIMPLDFLKVIESFGLCCLQLSVFKVLEIKTWIY